MHGLSEAKPESPLCTGLWEAESTQTWNASQINHLNYKIIGCELLPAFTAVEWSIPDNV